MPAEGEHKRSGKGSRANEDEAPFRRKEDGSSTYHKLFEYLAADFGFTIMAYVEPKPGVPPSAAYIERLIETIRESRPNGILSTPIYGRKEVDFLTEKTGVRGIVIPHDVGATPGAKDWFSFMDQALAALVK